jgi:transmembrane sensor
MSPHVKGEILQNIKSRTVFNRNARRFSPALMWGIAATISIIFIAAGYFFLSGSGFTEQRAHVIAAKMKNVSTLKGQKKEIKLPDGTRVKLNAASSISYHEDFMGDVRAVSLQGEAYFDVARDATRPFTVKTDYATTTVLGTSFNVLTTRNAVAVTLVEGTVNVSTPNGKTVLLHPNQQATVSRGSDISTKQVSVDQYIAWKDNTLYFDHIKVKDAVIILENWYNVDIVLKNPSIENCIVTAKYENESLENVLKSFSYIFKVDFEQNGRHVNIYGKGCL